MLKRIINPVLAFLNGETLPDLSVYEIAQKPRRNADTPTQGRTSKGKIYQGKEYVETEKEDGTIVTEQVKSKAETPIEVVLDGFDVAALDFIVGVKWSKDQSKAKVLKWHWQKGESAAQIEKAHTNKENGNLEKGYSERSVADYIKAFFDADDEREAQGKPRLREPRNSPTGPPFTVEW